MRHHNQRYAFLVSSSLDVRTGYGTATAVLGLMQALHRKGKRVGLLEPSPTPLSGFLRDWWFNRHLPSSLAGLDVDCVVGIDFGGYRYASLSGRRPFVALLHGVKADELLWAEGKDRSRLARHAVWEGRAAQHADIVVAPSAYACRRACEAYGVPPEKTRVVPNGIDLDSWPTLPPPDGPPRVLAGAQLIRRKGLDTLIAAWPQVKSRVKDAVLDIAGDGPQRQLLTALANRSGENSSITFHGALNQSDFRSLIGRSHVFCFPSRQEAFGLSALEAMACGRPVVATHAASLPEVIGDTGWLVEPESKEALAMALSEALLNTELSKNRALLARARASQFGWDQAASLFGEAAACA